MEIANLMLALGGDMNNTVPKFDCTASEIAILRAIHGDGAVYDVEPKGRILRTQREERARLYAEYGRAMGRENKPIISDLFPGAASRLFEDISELGMVEEQFSPKFRQKLEAEAVAKKAKTAAEKPVEKKNTLTKKELVDFLTVEGYDVPKNATVSQLADMVEEITAKKQAAVVDEEPDLDDFTQDKTVLD
jgi:hypothetical protein